MKLQYKVVICAVDTKQSIVEYFDSEARALAHAHSWEVIGKGAFTAVASIVEPMSTREVGRALGISGQAVTAMEKKALRKLRNQGKLSEFLCLLTDREDNYGDKINEHFLSRP